MRCSSVSRRAYAGTDVLEWFGFADAIEGRAGHGVDQVDQAERSPAVVSDPMPEIIHEVLIERRYASAG